MTNHGACSCFQRPRTEGRSTCCTRCGGRVLAWIPAAAADDALDVAAMTTGDVVKREYRGGEPVVLAAVSPDLGQCFEGRSWHVAAARVRDALAGVPH